AERTIAFCHEQQRASPAMWDLVLFLIFRFAVRYHMMLYDIISYKIRPAFLLDILALLETFCSLFHEYHVTCIRRARCRRKLNFGSSKIPSARVSTLVQPYHKSS
ncbi:unnamed protein product, partial [Laminaria digitata]